MTPDHYTYPTILPQHAGEMFFKEQIERLEIAVTLAVPVTRTFNFYVPPFEKTVPGRVLAFLEDHKDFISYRELGEKVIVSRKSAATAVNHLRKLGHKFDEKVVKQLMYVKLK